MTAAPYRVVDAGHWVFAGTGLRDGRHSSATESLHERCPGGASGHETDKIAPALAAGHRRCSPRASTRTTAAPTWSYYEPTGGGAVFSAGSITWPSSLLVDDHVSRITRNVLERYLG